MTNLWLDDMRREGDGWARAHSVNEAIEIMKAGPVEFASLDHDLGMFASDGGDGYKLIHWMIENETWPTAGVRVHSANPAGVTRMISDLEIYGPYEGGGGGFSFLDAEPWRGDAPVEGWPPTHLYGQ